MKVNPKITNLLSDQMTIRIMLGVIGALGFLSLHWIEIYQRGQQVAEQQALIERQADELETYQQALIANELMSEQQLKELDEVNTGKQQRLVQIDQLKQDVSTVSEMLVDKNLEISGLETLVTALADQLTQVEDQLAAKDKAYKRKLSSQLSAQRSRLAREKKKLETELKAVKKNEAELSQEVGDWRAKQLEMEEQYSAAAREVHNQDRVDTLMSQFNQLRVNLDVVNVCDKDYLYRYNEAKSVLSHLRTLIQKYEMTDDYFYFVIANDSAITARNRKLCIEN